MRRIRSMALHTYIRRLEQLAENSGVPVVRNCLSAAVQGRIEERRIVLRAGLTLEQQLLTLAHELTHLIVHCNASPRVNRTVCEYEAEAVEKWVGAALGAGTSDADGLDASMTEDLLACSVLRVRWASGVILKAARGGTNGPTPQYLQSQPAVKIDASTREKVVFHDELHGVCNLVRLA
jgi:IrrE N-terminal-like domain